jgi:hypothetical protein
MTIDGYGVGPRERYGDGRGPGDDGIGVGPGIGDGRGDGFGDDDGPTRTVDPAEEVEP